MSGPGAHAGNSASDAIRKGVGLVHGAGEAIRGNINAALDGATGNKAAAAQNDAIASRGVEEMAHGHRHNAGAAGNTMAPTVDQTNVNTAPNTFSQHSQQPSTAATSTTSTAYATPDTQPGTRVDPKVDSAPDPIHIDIDSVEPKINERLYAGQYTGHKLDGRYETDMKGKARAPGQQERDEMGGGPHRISLNDMINRDFQPGLITDARVPGNKKVPLPGIKESRTEPLFISDHRNPLVRDEPGFAPPVVPPDQEIVKLDYSCLLRTKLGRPDMLSRTAREQANSDFLSFLHVQPCHVAFIKLESLQDTRREVVYEEGIGKRMQVSSATNVKLVANSNAPMGINPDLRVRLVAQLPVEGEGKIVGSVETTPETSLSEKAYEGEKTDVDEGPPTSMHYIPS